MGKASKRKHTEPLQEGLISVRFIFNKKEYKRTHHMTSFELGQMKTAIERHGDSGANSAHWRAAIWGAGSIGERVMLEAAKDYMAQHPLPAASAPATVFDTEEDQDATE